MNPDELKLKFISEEGSGGRYENADPPPPYTEGYLGRNSYVHCKAPYLYLEESDVSFVFLFLFISTPFNDPRICAELPVRESPSVIMRLRIASMALRGRGAREMLFRRPMLLHRYVKTDIVEEEGGPSLVFVSVSVLMRGFRLSAHKGDRCIDGQKGRWLFVRSRRSCAPKNQFSGSPKAVMGPVRKDTVVLEFAQRASIVQARAWAGISVPVVLDLDPGRPIMAPSEALPKVSSGRETHDRPATELLFVV